jgi:hypothetical protein
MPGRQRAWILRLCSGSEAQKKKARVFDWRRSPGPSSAQRLCRRFAAPLCLPRPLLSSARGGALRIAEEPTYRLYSCQRCRIQVGICQRCDHGNIYCAGECSGLSRRESRRRAQARYQRTRRGALLHAARQRAWRTRREQTVTDHGCARGISCGNVSDHPILMSQLADARFPNPPNALEPLSRCAFCRTPLPAWARIGPRDYSG